MDWNERYNSFLTKWEQKMSRSKLEEYFKKELELEKKRHPQLTNEEAKLRTLAVLRMKLKGINLIPSEQFIGFVYAISNVVNMGEINYANARKIYDENPEKAIREGLVKVINDEVIPLDTRKTFRNGNPNPNFGKPLPKESKFRVVQGIARKANETEFKRFSLTLNDKMTELKIPLFVSIKFNANIHKSNENDYELFAVRTTEFELCEEKLDFKNLILNCGKDYVTELGKLKTWLNEHQNDRNALAIVEADVINLGQTPTQKGNYSIMLDDENLDVDEAVTGYMSETIEEQRNFGAYSKIIAVGRPMILSDNQTGEERLIFEVRGAWASEDYEVPTSEKIVDETETETTTDTATIEAQTNTATGSDFD